MTVITDPNQIARFRMASVFGTCKLSLQCVKGRFDRNAWAILAKEYGEQPPKSLKQKVALYRKAASDFPTFKMVDAKYLGGY